MRKFLIVAFILVMCLPFFAAGCAVGEAEEKYTANETEAVIEKYLGGSQVKEYTISDTYEGKPVTEIKDFALANNEYLEKITIGPNVKTISVWAFTNCRKLKEFVVSADNPYFTAHEGVLYNKDMSVLLAYPNSSHGVTYKSNGEIETYGSFVMPDSVVTVSQNAFWRCWAMNKIVFSNKLETLSDRSFFKCDKLESLVFPDTLKSIGEDCFGLCTHENLKEIYIPASVSNIGTYAFFRTKIATVNFASPNEASIVIGKDALNEDTVKNWGVAR